MSCCLPKGLGQEALFLPHPVLHSFLFFSCPAFPYPFKEHLWDTYYVPSTVAGAWLQREMSQAQGWL